MTVQEIRDIIKSADEEARHYEAAESFQKKWDFTVWMEYEAIIEIADDAEAESGWRFKVVRFTKTEYDQVAEKLRDVLQNTMGVTIRSYKVQYSEQYGYIKHYFDCEGV